MWQLIELIIGVVILWRIAIPFALSILLAVLLSHGVPFFDATAGIATAITGLTFGTYWHARNEEGLGLTEKRPTNNQSLSWPVAALGLIFIGFFWGAMFTNFTGSYWRSAVGLLLTTIPVLVWNKKVLHAELQTKALVFSYGLLLAGLALGILFHGISNGF
jgi:hypothetical protein